MFLILCELRSVLRVVIYTVRGIGTNNPALARRLLPSRQIR